MSELKPCPFCGSEAFINLERDCRWVECRKCGAMGYMETGGGEAEAIEAWNTRAERTCRIAEYNDAPFSVCSECGAVQPDDFTAYYCWSCGAKVVGE